MSTKDSFIKTAVRIKPLINGAKNEDCLKITGNNEVN